MAMLTETHWKIWKLLDGKDEIGCLRGQSEIRGGKVFWPRKGTANC